VRGPDPRPTLHEAAAVLAAVDAFAKAMHTSSALPPPADDLEALLDELVAAIERLRGVTADAGSRRPA
jgi:hypothetical protein